MKRLAILLLPLLLAPASSFAAERWTMARSPNFVIVGNASEAQITAIANELELFRSAYTRLFPIRVSSTQTTIVVFRSDEERRQYAPLQNGKPSVAPAIFHRAEDADHILLTGGLADTGVIYHEFAHSLMPDSIGELPLCITEGFAGYYRSFKVLPDNRRFQLGSPHRSHITRLASQFIPLEKLFTVSMTLPEYNEQNRQGVFYAESWALIHYLIHGEGGKYQARIPDLIAALRNGKPPAQAVMDVLQLTMAKLEEQLRAYVRKANSFSALEYANPTAPNTAAGMSARVMSEAETEFYRGDLLWRAQYMEEAEAHLRVAVSLDPNLGAAQASLGRLLDIQTKRTEAIPLLKRAAELDPTNYLAHFYYASAVWNSALNSTIRPTPAERELARSEGMKAIELKPQFLQATALVTRINLIGNENIGVTRTLILIRNARQLFPSRDDLALLEALVLTRTAERESVPQILRDLIARTPGNSQIRLEAERFLETFQSEATSRKTTLGNEAANAVKSNGVITGLDCTTGWALSVSSNGNTVVFKAPNPSTVRFVVYAATVRPPRCGGVPASGIPAIVTYRPTASGDAIGEALFVELFGD